jgi:hypothetical protein
LDESISLIGQGGYSYTQMKSRDIWNGVLGETE